MSPEKARDQARRSGVELEEERAWVGFYRRVGVDVAIATEVLAQLESDLESKRAHLALYLCCKESLRVHKVRQSRNKRIGHFVRWLCHGMLIAPAQSLRRAFRRGSDIAIECLPKPGKEPAVAQLRELKRNPEFAQSTLELEPAASAAVVTKPSRASKARPASMAA